MPLYQHQRAQSVHDWIGKRSLYGHSGQGFNNGLDSQIYGSMKCVRSWNPQQSVKATNFGAIFNFDFSTEGSILVAACEKKGMLIFDPLNGSLIGSKEKAHKDSVNCVKFLDSRMFATCSDDTTVKLWDIRSLKHKVMTLRGHTNWVKNIEYTNGMLVTSGFDGHINMWDINKLSQPESHSAAGSSQSEPTGASGVPACRRIFQMTGLMRCRITPDGSKLIIVSRLGYIVIIHDLDLENLAFDLRGFRHKLYLKMQRMKRNLSYSPEIRRQLNQMLMARRNRVEFIDDFPERDRAEMIASMDVHPQSWCIVSRNTSSVESSEWTCVHDIQGTREELDMDDSQLVDLNDSMEPESQSSPEVEDSYRPSNENISLRWTQRDRFLQVVDRLIPTASVNNGVVTLNSANFPASGSSRLSPLRVAIMAEIAAADVEDDDDRLLFENVYSDDEDSDDDDDDDDDTQERVNGNQNPNRSSANNISGLGIRVQIPVSINLNRASLDNMEDRNIRLNSQGLPKSERRLTHYIEESNVGRGYIKEICYSGDGRLIASPFGHGVRLLSFDTNCSEVCDCVHDSAVQLHELTSLITHSGIVLATKFSPTHTLLVSGCLAGNINFHQPLL